MSKEDIVRRHNKMNQLCVALNTSEAYICDETLTLVLGIPSVDPLKLEKLMEYRGLHVAEGESLYETIEKHYGKETADLAIRLV